MGDATHIKEGDNIVFVTIYLVYNYNTIYRMLKNCATFSIAY